MEGLRAEGVGHLADKIEDYPPALGIGRAEGAAVLDLVRVRRLVELREAAEQAVERLEGLRLPRLMAEKVHLRYQLDAVPFTGGLYRRDVLLRERVVSPALGMRFEHIAVSRQKDEGVYPVLREALVDESDKELKIGRLRSRHADPSGAP